MKALLTNHRPPMEFDRRPTSPESWDVDIFDPDNGGATAVRLGRLYRYADHPTVELRIALTGAPEEIVNALNSLLAERHLISLSS